MYLLLHFGSRPLDVAYIVRSNAIEANDYPDLEGDWKATVPASVTKTRNAYKWPIPKRLTHAIDLLQALHKKKGFVKQLGTQAQFVLALKNWFRQRVMPDAAKEERGVTEKGRGGRFYSMRSIRVWHGNEWAINAAIAKKEGLPEPFNPLQHTSGAMTRKKYAVRRVDRFEAGRIRK